MVSFFFLLVLVLVLFFLGTRGRVGLLGTFGCVVDHCLFSSFHIFLGGVLQTRACGMKGRRRDPPALFSYSLFLHVWLRSSTSSFLFPVSSRLGNKLAWWVGLGHRVRLEMPGGLGSAACSHVFSPLERRSMSTTSQSGITASIGWKGRGNFHIADGAGGLATLMSCETKSQRPMSSIAVALGRGVLCSLFFFFLFLTGGSWTYGMDQLSRSWFGWGVFWEWGETREGKQTQEVALCRIRSQKLNITLHFFALSEESERRNKPEMALSRRHVCMTTLNTYIESTVQQGAELQACVMRLSHG